MPRCPACNTSVSASELVRTEDILACATCVRLWRDGATMNENSVLSFTIDRLPQKDGEQDDYRVKLSFGYGGATITYDRRVSQMRDFFERRAQKRLPETAG